MALRERVTAVGTLIFAAWMGVALPAAAAEIRLVAADAGGVTLRLDIGRWEASPADAQGRSVVSVAGLHLLDSPGRPQLPSASTLIALPPGARVSASLVSAVDESPSGVRPRIGPRSALKRESGGTGYSSTIEIVPPILDGAWPTTDVALGTPFELRGQRLVAIELHPFRYDETSGRLTIHSTMIVRVSFVGATARAGAAAGEDRYVEPVLRGALLNYEQGRAFRQLRARGAAGAAPLFPARRPGRAGVAAFAFDEGQPEVRIKIDSTGVWSLDFDDLAAAGFPAFVPDSEVTVHRHEFLQDQTPPYGTLELPIELDDFNGNGIFDSGDRIVVYVQDWATRSGASLAQRGWGDAEVVYATRLPGKAGLRVLARPGDPIRTGLTPLVSYPSTRKYEKNSADIYGFPPDTLTDLYDWTSVMTYYDRPDTILFETSQLDTTHAVSLALELQGRKPGPHYLFAEIHNALGQATTLYDSTSGFAGTGRFGASATLTGSAVSEGKTNHLVLWGKDLPQPPDLTVNYGSNVGLNWFDFTYWRAFRPIQGYLDCNSAAAASPFEIFAPQFDDPTFLRAWDVTDPLDPRRMTGVALLASGLTWGVRFQDSTGATPRHYVVFNAPKQPPPDHFTPVTRRSLENHAAIDYVLITPEAFLPAVQPLVDLRQSEGLNVLVAPLESINDEFNGGRHADHAIRRLIRYAYYQWGARFVTLLGNGACEDPQNFMGTSTPDWIPAHRVLGPVGIQVGNAFVQEIVPSDNWYVWCIDDAGCPNPVSHPKVLDLYIGRLPVNSLADAQAVVHKLVRYETVSPSDQWRRRMTLSSDDDFSGENFFGGNATNGYCQRDGERVFVQLNGLSHNVILNEAGLSQSSPDLWNLGDFLTNEAITVTPCVGQGCDPDTCRDSRIVAITHARATATPELFRRLNEGRLWWNYQGHANEQLLAHESFYVDDKQTIDDSQNFTNAGMPFFFSAFSCHVNNFGRRTVSIVGPGVGADLVIRGNDEGAIAAWASTGYELVPTNQVDHLNVELARALFSQPPRDPNLGDRGARVVLGEAVALTLLRWQPLGYLGEREVGVTYALLGDPATRLSIGSPQALVIANGDTVTSGLAERLKTPGDTLRVDADLASNQQITSLALERSVDGAAAIVVPPAGYTLAPAFGDTTTGGRRYHLTYRTSLTANSYLYTLRTLDREGTPGTFDVSLPFQCVLRAEGAPINDGDPIAPGANLSLLVISPAPVHPGSDLSLTLNGQAVAFDSTMVAGDATGRQWVLTWSHPAYPIDAYTLRLSTASGAVCTHTFKVDVGGGELRLQNVLAFPNPFDDDRGAVFSFIAVSGAPVDVQIRVFTLTGQLIYSHTERQLVPGYHQIPWDGRDAEGSSIANGIYVYRLLAGNGSSTTSHQGRLVKLRRPRRLAGP